MNEKDCNACGKEKDLIEVDKVGCLCKNCYEDGIVDSTMYMALYFMEKRGEEAVVINRRIENPKKIRGNKSKEV